VNAPHFTLRSSELAALHGVTAADQDHGNHRGREQPVRDNTPRRPEPLLTFDIDKESP